MNCGFNGFIFQRNLICISATGAVGYEEESVHVSLNKSQRSTQYQYLGNIIWKSHVVTKHLNAMSPLQLWHYSNLIIMKCLPVKYLPVKTNPHHSVAVHHSKTTYHMLLFCYKLRSVSESTLEPTRHWHRSRVN